MYQSAGGEKYTVALRRVPGGRAFVGRYLDGMGAVFNESRFEHHWST